MRKKEFLEYKQSQYVLLINDNRVELPYPIRKCIEYNGGAIVLFYDDAVISNNVEFYDKNGNKIWSINDLLKIKNPRGNVDIEMENDSVVCVTSSIGVVYRINITTNELIGKIMVK